MEASKFLPEGDPYSPEGSAQPPNVVVLVEQVEGAEPIYHFFVDGSHLDDVGATRELSEGGLITYNFFNDYKQFAAADLIDARGTMSLDWAGPEGDHHPDGYMELLPHLVAAAVYADYGVIPSEGRYSP